MTISTIISDARTWQDRHVEILDAYLAGRRALQQLGLGKAEYLGARDLLRVVLIQSRRREAA